MKKNLTKIMLLSIFTFISIFCIQVRSVFAEDKTYTSILKWMLEENSLNISLANWLYIIDEESEYYDAGYVEVTNGMITDLAEKTNLPKGFLTDIKNGNYVNDKQIEIISNDEDRLIVYYVLANHPEKYSTFITEWQTYTTRQNSVTSNVKKWMEVIL